MGHLKTKSPHCGNWLWQMEEKHVYTFSHCIKIKSRQTVVSKELNLSDMDVTSSKLVRFPSDNMEEVGFMTYMPASHQGAIQMFGHVVLLCLAHALFSVLLLLFVSCTPLHVHGVSSLFSPPQIGKLRNRTEEQLHCLFHCR